LSRDSRPLYFADIAPIALCPELSVKQHRVDIATRQHEQRLEDVMGGAGSLEEEAIPLLLM